MKYKIGNVEVEAVQWNGDIKLITDTWPGIKDALSIKDRDAFNQDILSILWVSNRITHGEYMVKSQDGRMFILGRQDFNNMATKVKEPKFKVGDVVYFCNNQDHLECRKVSIISAHPEKNIISYYIKFKDGSCAVYNECFLFTKEEAIEKLKEL